MYTGYAYEPQNTLAPDFVSWVAIGLVVVFLIGSFGAVGFVGFFVWNALIGWRSGKGALSLLTDNLQVIFGMSFAFIVTATMINAMACCENARHFQNVSIFPLVIGTYMIAMLGDRLKKRLN